MTNGPRPDAIVFGAANGARLDVGHYADAPHYVFGHPVLDACPNLHGPFDVLAFSYAPGAEDLSGNVETGKPIVDRLDVDFEYTCGEGPAQLHGKIRYTR